MATANGVVKKTALDAFKHLRHRGIIAIVLDEDDDLIAARLTDGNQEILLSSEAGMACRFRESDVRPQGRATHGVRGMELRDPAGRLTSRIVSMTIVNPKADLLVITAKGMGKRTHLGTGIAEQDRDLPGGGGYRLTRRAGKGVISIRLREGDRGVAAIQLEKEEDILLGSVHGQLVRINTRDIRPMGRNSQGVRIMRLREGDEISSVSIVARLDDDELAEQQAGAAPDTGDAPAESAESAESAEPSV
jgi:DNA gyrase subunit A